MRKISGIKLYEVPDLVRELQSTRVTVQKYIREGRIPGTKIAGKWYVSEENFRAFLTGKTVPYKVPGE